MRPDDLATIASLCVQLGYPVSDSELSNRFAALSENERHEFLVVSEKSEVHGWCHVFGVPLLESEGYAELGGLVVEESARRRGLGLLLVRAAEQWAVSRGFTRLRMYCRSHREDAHRFYRGAGYEESEPMMFQRALS